MIDESLEIRDESNVVEDATPPDDSVKQRPAGNNNENDEIEVVTWDTNE